MATESPMRMIESSGATKWHSSKDTLVFGSPLKDVEVEELRLLLKGQRIHGDQTDTVPNRSGSAPPSMEGSFAALGNLLAQKNTSLTSSLASLSSVIKNCESEEQLRSDPAYFAYYCSNINLNPRLPPPLISRENRRLARHIGGFGNNWRATSVDDSGNGLPFYRSSLFPHKEEPEDDRSPGQSSDKWVEDSTVSLLEQDSASLTGRHKSLVDLIQEDFPRTPSPVYNQSRSSGISTAEEPIDHDVHAISSNISSINASKVPESKLGSPDVCRDTSALDAHTIGLISPNDSLDTSIPSSLCSEQVGRLPTPPKEDTNMKDFKVDTDASDDVPQSVVSTVESRMKKKQEAQQSRGRNMPQHYSSTQQGSPHQAQALAAQSISQGLSHLYSHPKFSSVGSQPLLPSSGLSPTMYTTAAAYMTSGNPLYPNFQPSGLYAPQYNVGGYAMNPALLPPFMGGYPSHGVVPMPFDSTASGSSFNNRTSGASNGEGTPHTSDLQHLGHFYGQQGLVLPPSLVDPLHVQYLHSFSNVYGASVQHGHLASTGVSGGQVDSFVQKEPNAAAYMGDPKLQPPTNGRLSIPNPGKVGSFGGSYYGSHPSMGVIAQYPTSPLASPLMPSSPVGGMSPLGRRSDIRFPPKGGPYSGWQGQRVNSFEDSKRHSFLEELKSGNARKFELSNISGHIVEFSVDQHGSRFIQQKLEHCSVEDKESVFKEVLPHASRLMTDVFGNYVIQKFFEHGSSEQRKELADQLVGNMLNFSLQMYGCRVIQKFSYSDLLFERFSQALEVIELDQKTQLVQELDGHIMKCVHDQNGNHVIQKCIERVPTDRIGFIISAFRGQVATLSTHPYGCRVIQRVLENCSDKLQSQCIVDEILDAAFGLSQDQYGNYVTQHVLERGKPHERSHIISKLTGKIVQMSQHKYASNVVEKCLVHGDSAERELLVEEIIGQSDENDTLLTMMKDQFANYVVQKVLEISNERQRELLLDRVRVHLNALKKYTYGKHIAARFEQLLDEESDACEEH
ncbi:pumilio homolog 5 isoform X2 [Durio zibethinus]|uniref:Pumilio homolog 5 isoform X2 n=1 Tax=Durio zibethinus TaxID=66656 RepID=A0A6P5WKE1_DURZI|nr:pumilio homolog 5 isoform X2 [Durio zibethinus]